MSEFILGGFSACCACVMTNPLEVIKTRLQLQGELKSKGKYEIRYRNIFHAFYSMARSESLLSLQKGLIANMYYQFVMNSVRFGLFQSIDNFNLTKNSKGDISFVKTVVASAFSGVSGAVFGSPFYMIKIHLQAKSNIERPVGYQHKYNSLCTAFKHIFKQHGLRGLWRGSSGAMCRVTVGSSVQLTSFSHIKQILEKRNIIARDSWLSTLVSATLGGAAVSVFMTPLDVVSTRLYNQPVNEVTGKGINYTGVFDCIKKIYVTENFLGFYKGWSAAFLRIGPHTMLSLFIWQELRKYHFEIKPSNGHFSASDVNKSVSLTTKL